MTAHELDGRLRIGGERVAGVDRAPIIDPYRAQPIASIEIAGPDQVASAIADADANGRPAMASMPLHRRVAALRSAAALILEEVGSLATLTTRQTGKAVRDARREAERSAATLGAAASAAERMDGTIPRADALAGGEGILALVMTEPIGVVAAISPFNSPVNLPIHKLAPALVMGNAVVFKPAPQAPLSGHRIVEILIEAGFPASAIQVVTGGPSVGAAMVGDARIGAVSFTGGTAAGIAIARTAGLKRLLLELGGNSPNVVHADADLDHAATALVAGAFGNTGQSCNSVQRILVHRSIAAPLTDLLRTRAGHLRVGDPLDPETEVGTLVDEAAAVRVESWIHAAIDDGAAIVVGGRRTGAQLEPTILADVRPEQDIACQEVFGPVAVVMEYGSLAEAIELANTTEYGLQAAVFTRSLGVAQNGGSQHQRIASRGDTQQPQVQHQRIACHGDTQQPQVQHQRIACHGDTQQPQVQHQRIACHGDTQQPQVQHQRIACHGDTQQPQVQHQRIACHGDTQQPQVRRLRQDRRITGPPLRPARR